MKFIIISPAYNEANHIRFTLESITKQSVLPEQWIIVNDGSTDSTSEIINEYIKLYPWIKLLECGKEDVEFGVHAVVNFNKGLNACDITDWDYVMKLDTDLDIDRNDFIEFQLKMFQENPKLGICSGITYTIINGEKVLTKGRHYWRTGGAMKFYRRICYEQIGGLTPIYGWDGMDEYKAMYYGWKTRTFFELKVNHLGKQRANERMLDKEYFLKRGNSFYKRGYPFEFIVIKTLSYLKLSPIKALKFLNGYLKAWFDHEKYLVTIEERRFFRKLQYLRILDFFVSKELL
jgi:poly-beta-1,6-N-acetyl-D-glucosamine synthase